MKNFLLLLCFHIAGIISFGQTARVIGYLPTYRFSSSSQIEYCKLTHLNLSFANPDSDGNLEMPDISSVMTDALNDNPSIIICISLGGGVLSAQQKTDWSNLIDIPSNRPAFISKIVDYVVVNNLDGVDMDLEWNDVTSGYSDFVVELDTALSLQNKMITVAFPNQTLFANVNDAALEAFDFINIMSYDATGSWNPSSPGQHSSYDFSVNGINFWKNGVEISGSRLNLGVPFYGYDFVNSTTANAVTYAQMVDANTSNADLDHVENTYYNGRPTIEAKVELANNEVGGIMIWEIGQDSFDEYSLLHTIHNKYTSLGITTTGLCGNEDPSAVSESEIHEDYIIYPNPATNYFTISQLDVEHTEVRITNTLGQIINVESSTGSGNTLIFDVSRLQNGFYFVSIINKGKVLTTNKLMVNEQNR